jgi:signal transduction histidine kinase
MKSAAHMEVPTFESSGAVRERLDPGESPLSGGQPRSLRAVVARISRVADESFSKLSKVAVGCLASGLVVLVAWDDSVSHPDLSFSLFYFIPGAFAAWYGGSVVGCIVSLIGTITWSTAELHLKPSLGIDHLVLNAFFRLGVFAFVTLILSSLRQTRSGLERKVAERTRELELEVGRRVAMERELAVVSHREQQRIAYELHDGLGQELGGLAFQSKMLASRLRGLSSPLAEDAERLVAFLNRSIGKTRALSRLLDPVGGETVKLRDALSQLVDYSGEAFSVGCTLQAPEQLPALGQEANLHLYRIAQESIRNAMEHGEATHVSVSVEVANDLLTLTISDNGCGLKEPSPSPEAGRGMGLRIMNYRAAALGARVEITSNKGAGSQVTCELPLHGAGSTP